MKLYKNLALAVMFSLIMACGAEEATGGGGEPAPTELEIFAAKLAENKTPVISVGTLNVANAKALISDDGNTITSVVEDAFGGTVEVGSTWTLLSINKETADAHTVTYAQGDASVPATDLVLTFTDINADTLAIVETEGVKYGGEIAVIGKLGTANDLILSINKDLQQLTSTTGLTASFANLNVGITGSGWSETYFNASGSVPEQPTDTLSDVSYVTVLTAISTGGIKAVLTFSKDAVTFGKNTVTIPDLSKLGADDGLTLTDDASNKVGIKFES